jgi:alkyl hydroperoxide reductase subunit AhpC
MAAGTYDILIEQGATFSIILSLKDENFVAIDLTGLEFRGYVKKAFTDTTTEAEFSFEILDQDEEETKGKVKVILSATETSAMTTNATGISRNITTMVYDIESESVDGEVTRWLQGEAKVSPEVTK